MKVSVSEILHHNLCPEFWWNRYRERRIAIGETSDAQRAGTYAHEHLAKMMRGEPWIAPETKILAAERALDLVLAAWWERYKSERPWDTVLETEQPLSYKLADDIELIGIPDAAVLADGKLWHLQHKTIGPSVPVSVFAMGVAQSLHEAAYAELLSARWGYEYGGTMLNVLKRPSEKTALANVGSCLHLEFIPITREQRARALSDILVVARRMQADEISNWRPRRREACTGFYGSRLCGYYASCWQGIDIHDDLMFEDHDPNARYNEE